MELRINAYTLAIRKLGQMHFNFTLMLKDSCIRLNNGLQRYPYSNSWICGYVRLGYMGKKGIFIVVSQKEREKDKNGRRIQKGEKMLYCSL